MGRDPTPFVMLQPNTHRRTERARRAKDTINKALPDILRSSPRARHGIHKSDLVVDPEPPTHHGTFPLSSTASDSAPKIRLLCTDTLDAAARLSERPFATRRTAASSKVGHGQQRPNVMVLSFASPLKPGGGFLEGANSQEEFLCARTTVYPSLWDSFYRLPEVGGILTPDVMVFRDSTPEANELLKRDRYFVDVVSAGMLRFPETRGRASDEKPEHGCSCGVSYCDRDRELVTRKMKAVMRIAQAKGAERLVLGAWGCGAYGNPVKEVARIWRKVIAGSLRQRRPNVERWQGIKEIVFAIPDRNMAREFELAFKDVLTMDAPSSPLDIEDTKAVAEQPVNEDAETSELVTKIQETEMQIELITNPRSRQRLREVLANLNRDLAQSLAARRTAEDLPPESDRGGEEEEGEESYIAITSDGGEESTPYHFDSFSDAASDDSSDATIPEAFEFRPQEPGLDDFETSHDEEEEGFEGESQTYSLLGRLLPGSQGFDAKTGWFSGSIDQLQGLLRAGGVDGRGSRGSPEVGAREGGGDVEEFSLEDVLGR
ncbi:hypothetical protein B0A54_06184 [Friedmanniomyces endolithicus]|uniref:Microbial-type PARG catalytic domain-containing protein n=1 Tax=Friedmanniomyces endolithicus TaxID=329885 RepID=A0A4U0UZM1_9PEZI|nr:hypothetical protein LTS09_001694 [Friedmanniomyces endolithicus]TKA41282.1 hypothetical protein B0A54_06184 [Friedmanniomyces endolithicus]